MKDNRQIYCKEVYPVSIIREAIKDYERIATIEVSDDGKNYCCTFKHCAVDTARVIREFDNYLIELLNSHGASSLL